MSLLVRRGTLWPVQIFLAMREAESVPTMSGGDRTRHNVQSANTSYDHDELEAARNRTTITIPFSSEGPAAQFIRCLLGHR
ncbi:hypothetical protein C8Q74DRAFT_1255871 [Fomes fomentarius]|nr:hypothetical protein C8Q74DRAFT_1255871 [Fomes fomentarius]